MSEPQVTIELIQWNCPTCKVFGGGVSPAPAQEHADAYGHNVEAEVTKTVVEQVVITPR